MLRFIKVDRPDAVVTTGMKLDVLEGMGGERGLRVLDVGGLGPTNANVVSDQSPSGGNYFSGSYLQGRNITFDILIDRFEDVVMLRDKIYRTFLPGALLDITLDVIKSGTTQERYTSGVVEYCEPNYFSDEPKVSISILCESPYLMASPIQDDNPTLVGLYEMEFDIEGSGDAEYEFEFRTGAKLPIMGEPPNVQKGDLRLRSTSPGGLNLTLADMDYVAAGVGFWALGRYNESMRHIEYHHGTFSYPALHRLSRTSRWVGLRAGEKIRLRLGNVPSSVVLSSSSPRSTYIKYTPTYRGL